MMEKYNINQTTLKILALYTNNYKKSLHLREIARATNVDVKAVRLQLKRLEGLNVMSSIVKGRNKEYCLNLSNLVTKYYMVLAETFVSISYLGKNFLIKKVISEIENKIEGSIILFGSFVKGQVTKKSDIDLFVITEKKLDKNVVEEAANLVGREISVKSSSKKRFLKGLEDGDPLIREVVSGHIALKGVDDLCDIMWRYYARR